MEIIINEKKLNLNQIQEFNSKVRAILIDDNNRILVANYGKVILLPGGSIDEGENLDDAIKRELKEEIGITYDSSELKFLTTLKFFQKNYPKRNGTFCNRLIQTHYFIGKYKGISCDNQNLTEKEKNDGFKLELLPLEQLELLVSNNKNENPRNIYFQKELITILQFYNKSEINSVFKKKKSL